VAGVIREDYKNPASKRQGQTIFGAWAAVDTGLQRCGLTVTAEINASTVKKIVGGHGKAEKDEVADGVRRILGQPTLAFATNDESDACAIVLAYLIERGEIDS
jgi:crossover junction endodeoxyribonuclease RuvC